MVKEGGEQNGFLRPLFCLGTLTFDKQILLFGVVAMRVDPKKR